jgi:hypothetical protein
MSNTNALVQSGDRAKAALAAFSSKPIGPDLVKELLTALGHFADNNPEFKNDPAHRTLFELWGEAAQVYDEQRIVHNAPAREFGQFDVI